MKRAAVVVALVLALAGCGPDDGQEPTPNLSDCLQDNKGIGCDALSPHLDRYGHLVRYRKRHPQRPGGKVVTPVCNPISRQCAL